MTADARKKARNKYNWEKKITKSVNFNRITETDLIDWIQDQRSFCIHVKDLIK